MGRKHLFLFLGIFFSGIVLHAQTIYRLNYKPLHPDSLVSFYNELTASSAKEKASGKFIACGFEDGYFGLRINAAKERSVVFSIYSSKLSASSKINVIASGENSLKENAQSISWKYNWQYDSTYRFLVRALPDNASNTLGYSAYFYSPELNAWKFIGTIQITNYQNYLRSPYSSVEYSGNRSMKIFFKNIWTRNASGRSEELNKAMLPCDWRQSTGGTQSSAFYLETNKNPKPGQCDKLLISDSTGKRPVTAINKNIDSIAQGNKELLQMKQAISDGKIDTTGSVGGVWYKILKEGTGETINETDTITVFYKGWTLNGSVFDSTSKEPAVFPLNRLIKGFQLGMVKCRVGGKVRMIIPSALGYGPSNVSFNLPPNSILIFDVEVVNAIKQK